MCLIVDVNIAHRVFPKERAKDPDFGPVHKALFGNGAGAYTRVVIGGQLTREYEQMAQTWNLVVQLEKAGRVMKVREDSVKSETERLRKKKLCKSDDPHVIALARVGHVRLLCTLDDDLTDDFKDAGLISNPRGKVYRNSDHEKLIRERCRVCSLSCRK